MPTPAPPVVIENDIIELTIKGVLCGQTVLTVLHYRVDTVLAPSLPDVMDELHTAIGAAGELLATYNDAAASNYAMNETVAQVISPTRWARFAYLETGGGTQADEARTADLACVIEKSTWFITERALKLDRGFTGSIHFAPVPYSLIEEGLIDTGYLDDFMQPLGTKACSPITGGTGTVFQPIIYHRDSAGVKYTDINRFHPMPEARVMRRRTVGRGI